MKMIIRNCPCFVEGIAIKGNEQKTQTCNNYKVRELTLCQNCTDCVMKQIVELCKYYKKHSDCGRECPSFGMFLSKLLGKLDIEEVE